MLSFSDLNIGFLELMDTNYPGFKGHKQDIMQVSQDWMLVFQKFYLNMILPIPGAANSNLMPSLQIFQQGLLGAINSQSVVQMFEQLVLNLHIGVCTGVTMTGIWATTPPPQPLILQDCFNTQFSASQVANLMANKIFTWVMTTFSTQTVTGMVMKWM